MKDKILDRYRHVDPPVTTPHNQPEESLPRTPQRIDPRLDKDNYLTLLKPEELED